MPQRFSLFPKKELLGRSTQEQIVRHIRAAEARTTGEIRVFVESRCTYVDAMDRAAELFARLGMDQTARRNAVLLYIALKDHQFAIYGDQAIYEQAGGQAFWTHAAEALRAHFSAGRLADGISDCVRGIGDALALHFPADPAVSKNELPDEIVFGK